MSPRSLASRGCGGHIGRGDGQGAVAVGGKGRTAVEARPSKPEDAAAQDHERQVPILNLEP